MYTPVHHIVKRAPIPMAWPLVDQHNYMYKRIVNHKDHTEINQSEKRYIVNSALIHQNEL